MNSSAQKANTSLVWFRRDLRLNDNSALSEALKTSDQVIAFYIFSKQDQLSIGNASKWYLHQSLLSLQNDLAQLNIELFFEYGDPQRVLLTYIEHYKINKVLCNRVVEPNVESTDLTLSKVLTAINISYKIFDDDCLVMPEKGYKADGTPYRVFTPFWKTLQNTLEASDYSDRLIPLNQRPLETQKYANKNDINILNLLPSHSWYLKLHQYWEAGEAQAYKRFQTFLSGQIINYDLNRDFPSLNGTSRLSAALHFGEISAIRIYDECQKVLSNEESELTRKSINRFLSEIAWREFARHVLHANPQSPTQSLNPKFDQYSIWSTEPGEKDLMAWQKGETGIPIIDAGMKELWETGTMHNRVRMLVGSFLTKNLGIHWKAGAKWFWDTLVDADLASNTLGWQWVAGCGTDASPYYRIFNPELQAKKFDAHGHYISKWVNPNVIKNPIIDLSSSREDALNRYSMMKH